MKKKKKGVKIALIVMLCLIGIGLGVLGYYLYEQANSGLFFENTKINGYDVTGKTAKEVMLILERDYSAPELTINEGGQEALTLTLEDMGYTVDEMKLLSELKSCMREQNVRLLFSLMGGNEFEVEIPFEFDEDTFNEAVSASRFLTPRKASVDASLEYNGTEYYIEPEVYGNEMDDADLRVMVKDYADKVVAADRPQKNGTLEVPESFYFLPAVTQDDGEMNTMMGIYNSYCKAKISLTFGEKKEVVDWSVVQNWLNIEGGEATLNEEAVYDYVYELAARYDTLYHARDFTTHDGRTIHYESSDYGYQIDCDAEAQQLIQDIYANTAVEREPVYAVKGYKRNGQDDVVGTYVEADLTKQHLWFYIDGKVVVESDFVSGLPKDGRETATGVFMIPYKTSPEVLEGDTWREEVTYWMPFHDGQGLHDAPWRNEFGGNIYQTGGSHGCINLPPQAAATIYENMQERMPIFLYK
ncbi:MAG: L,D-transpeptidase family protein [Lachnospiraceae bacterium]|uniref:L,D-transpeptidase family protein n=1 Tax=Parablautia sp. Marseille-Q6255 TaxID=3039593 RepID=UPI0024BBF838|nr:L,D-transpeptidase family protein [Parablautia sp. Marseille-Q6255]